MNKTFRKTLFWGHLIAGLVAGVVIMVKAVTGVILAYEHQIVDWAESSMRTIVVPADPIRLTPEALVEKVNPTVSKGKFSGLTMKSDPAASALVMFGREGGAYYVNPYTGEVLGKESKTHDAMHAIDDFHRWFGFRAWGRPVSGAATLLFFLIALSGIFLWWPSTWTKSKVKSITAFNGKLTGKARDFNWHNVIGFWSLPFILIIAGTGVIMSYQWANDLLYRVTGNEPPPVAQRMERPKPGEEPKKEEIPMIGLNTLWAKAEAQVPGWFSISLRLPQKPGGPVSAFIMEYDHSVGLPPRSQLTLDASTGEVTKWEPFSGHNSGRKARIWARYLHSGEVGGWVGQTIAFFVTAGVAVLVWTGFALTWRRYRNWKKQK